ncbi:MAG: DnaD domain protein ['Conium maculatum' witches'-broom phytoplasma]|nr:DnaD domain protein ['Conium maculatum' witches'-broom phytoplasma]
MFTLQNFNVHNCNILSYEEQKILTLLYQPLIGTDTIGLYYTLSFLNTNDLAEPNLIHQFLLDLLNIDEKTFFQLKDKLEAVNLLTTYQNKKKEHLYSLNPPLSAVLFFQDPLLSQFLLSEVGEHIYFSLEKILLPENYLNLTTYQNVSKHFTDVYHFEKINPQETLNSFKHNNEEKKQATVLQKYFNYETFLNHLSERFKKPFLLEWQNMDYIIKLAFVYALNPEEMAILYQDSFRNNYEDDLDLNHLRNSLNLKFSQSNAKIKALSNKNLNTETNEMILYLKNSHPHRIIKNFSKNKRFGAGLYDIVFLLLKKTEVEIGVINALIMYVCKIKAHKDDSFISYNYFNTILKSWTKKGIVTTETAYDYLMEENVFKTSKKDNKNSPKWLDDFKKELGFKN